MIFISGGGNAIQSFNLDKLFVQSLKGGKVLYIPIALGRDIQGYEACFDWIVGTLSQHSPDFIDISMILDLSKVDERYLDQFMAVYMGGGNTFKLLNEIKKAKFDKLINVFLGMGKIIYGGSAGAIVLGKTIDTIPEEKEKNVKSDGLNLLNGYSICCHYKESDDEKIQKFIKKYQMPVIALPEGEGLILENGKLLRIVGDNIKMFALQNKNDFTIENFHKYQLAQ